MSFNSSSKFQSFAVGIAGLVICLGLIAGSSDVAVAGLGDCSQPVSTGVTPKSSDCLFILQVSVGTEVCEPACICDPTGAGGATSTDSLLCLKKAVGEEIELLCPCVPDTTTTTVSTTTTTLPPVSVSGLVTDASNTPVAGGQIYFVPADDVAALPATVIAVDSASDEPLEDTIAANGAGYQTATVGVDGTYDLPDLAGGSYFVTFVPDAGDTAHLPGGSLCRTAMSTTEMAGALDIQVSSAAPPDAVFIGSGACVSCHGLSHIAETLHRIGIWSSYENGDLQDLTPRFAEMYQAIDGKFKVEGGTTVYFYDYDSTRGFDKYKTAESDPGANVSFTVTVQENGEDLEMVLHNVKNPLDPDRIYRVDLVYGGGVLKQRYMTKLTNEFGTFHVLLPLQFQHEGSENPPYGRTSKVWRDYNGYKWFTESDVTSAFKEPVAKDSFEKNCISCHAVGSRIYGSDDTAWGVELVEDTVFNSGDLDFDGNLIRDEVNVGCESCHGPGSTHATDVIQGQNIVSPALLTPEREAMICGQCHSRPKGAFATDSPVNGDGRMMIAGTSRADFLAEYATSQLDGAATDYFADTDDHSKSHHQQYTDFIRSALYKNGEQLLTCATCHDPHTRTDFGRQLKTDPTDNVASCGNCHDASTAGLEAHLLEQGFATSAAFKSTAALCSDCHMPKTAKTGAGKPGRLIGSVQYWMNDITSHLFKVPNRIWANAPTVMPVPYTNACGSCHTTAP